MGKGAGALFGRLIFLIVLGLLSYWIAHNIFQANELEIREFFEAVIIKIKNFFSVIFYGENGFTYDVKFSWWIFAFCVACYPIIYSAIGLCCVASDLNDFANAPLDKSEKGEKDL